MNNQTKIILGLTLSISLSACGGGSSLVDSAVNQAVNGAVSNAVDDAVSDAVDNSVDNAGDQNNSNTNDGTDNTDNTNTNTNTGNNTNAGMGAGSGGCVTFPRPQVGQIVKRELKGAGVTQSIETEIMAVSSTSITQKIKDDQFLLESINVENYTIANNFRDITSESTTISSFTFNTTYTPFQRVAVDQVCEGQTWTTVYTEKESGEPAVSVTQTYTIEAVNVSKTSKAGTFNTFRVGLVDTRPSMNLVGKTWIDISSGYDVFSEFSDTSAGSDGTLELIETNF